MITLHIVSDPYPLNQAHFQQLVKSITGRLDMSGTITVKFAGIEESRSLNKQYLGLDQPTDVLSFPSHEKSPEGFYIGDLLICFPVAEEQAVANKLSTLKELSILIIHGILHLAGYDHETDRGEMFKLQDELVGDLLGDNSGLDSST